MDLSNKRSLKQCVREIEELTFIYIVHTVGSKQSEAKRVIK